MKSKTFALALLTLWPLALSAAPDPNTGHFKNLSVTGTNSANELVVTNGLTLGSVRQTAWGADLAWSQLCNRRYQHIVSVTTTISNAVNGVTYPAIANAAWNNRYLIYVPNGIYNEYFTVPNPWIDIVGQSRSGVIVTNASTASTNNDTIKISGMGTLLANLTIYNTTSPGQLLAYAVHADASTPAAAFGACDYFLVNCSVIANGGNSKSGLGVGLWGGQSLRAFYCSFSSEHQNGIFIHNEATQLQICKAYFVDCTAVSTLAVGGNNSFGLGIQNLGSGQDDQVFVLGGSYTGNDAGINVSNTGAGAGESYLLMDTNAVASSIASVNASHTLVAAQWPIPAIVYPQDIPAINVNGPFQQTNSAATMNGVMFTSGGKVGIYDTNPSYPLTVQGTNNLGTVGAWVKQFGSASSTIALYAQNTYNVGVGDSYGIKILNSSGNSGVGYGLYVDDMTPVTSYGIYNKSSPSYFGGTMRNAVTSGGTKSLVTDTSTDTYFVNVDGVTVTLANATGVKKGQRHDIWIVSPANSATIATIGGGQLINGAASISITGSNRVVLVRSDGTNWWGTVSSAP